MRRLAVLAVGIAMISSVTFAGDGRPSQCPEQRAEGCDGLAQQSGIPHCPYLDGLRETAGGCPYLDGLSDRPAGCPYLDRRTGESAARCPYLDGSTGCPYLDGLLKRETRTRRAPLRVPDIDRTRELRKTI